jgi:hypothetical protein
MWPRLCCAIELIVDTMFVEIKQSKNTVINEDHIRPGDKALSPTPNGTRPAFDSFLARKIALFIRFPKHAVPLSSVARQEQSAKDE